MTDHHRAAFLWAPFHESRFWLILLWVLAITGGLALMNLAERHFRTQATGQPIMLLSQRPGDAEQRAELRRQIITQPGIAGARWRTPEELTAAVSGRFPQQQWVDLFPGDVAWLPWVLEVYPANPLADITTIRALVTRCRQQTETWSVVLWDSETINRLARQRRNIRLTLGFWILLAGLSGIAGLMRLPAPQRGGKALIAWSGLTGTFAPTGVWIIGWLSNGQADLQTLAIASGTGFVMSVVIAPLLRVRRRQSKSWVVSEESDERKNDR